MHAGVHADSLLSSMGSHHCKILWSGQVKLGLGLLRTVSSCKVTRLGLTTSSLCCIDTTMTLQRLMDINLNPQPMTTIPNYLLFCLFTTTANVVVLVYLFVINVIIVTISMYYDDDYILICDA